MYVFSGNIMLGNNVDVMGSLWWYEYYSNRYGCGRFQIVRTVGMLLGEFA